MQAVIIFAKKTPDVKPKGLVSLWNVLFCDNDHITVYYPDFHMATYWIVHYSEENNQHEKTEHYIHFV